MVLHNSNTLGIVSNSPRTRAVRSIKQWVADGRLAAGERLPSEMRLAAKLNVSRSTIRLALSDLEKEGIIAAEKHHRTVLKHLKPERPFLSDAIALITEAPELFERKRMHGTWHSNYIHTGAVDAIRNAGYDVLNIHPNRVAGDMIQPLIHQRPRRAIIMHGVLQAPSGQHITAAFQEGNVPFVVYGDFTTVGGNSNPIDCDSVVSDHHAGSYMLTKWLIGQGRRRILRIWQLKISGAHERREWMKARDEGFLKAMHEAGLPSIPAQEIFLTEEEATVGDRFLIDTRLMAGYLIEHLAGPNPIDAIMAVSDAIVPTVAAALKLHGKIPNRDVLLVGYDNMREDVLYLDIEPTKPVATIDKNNLEIGCELMRLLQDRIQGALPTEPQRRVASPELIIFE